MYHKHKNAMWSLYSALYPYRKYKPFTKILFKHFKGRINLIGCEIGVYRGVNAKSMIYGLLHKNIGIKKMYLVDPYIKYVDIYLNEKNVGFDTRKYKKLAKKYLKCYNNICYWLYMRSEKAIWFIEDLDFCYIDADHSYEAVRRDIRLYWFRIKKGGILGGHDYAVNYPGVRKAVDEFVKRYTLELLGYGDDWCVVK